MKSLKIFVLVVRTKDGKTEVQMRDEWFTETQFARFKKQIESDGYEKANYDSIEVKGFKTFSAWSKAAKKLVSVSAHNKQIPTSESWFTPY